MASDAEFDDLKRPTALFFFPLFPVNARQFSLVANVAYPELYQRLLDVITLANFDLGWIPSAACIMDVDFHVELVAATVGPLLLVASLGLTYTIALHRNRGSERALSAVQRKHANATIVIALLLYSMTSSAVFRAFACDSLDDGRIYLRSDYRIDCDSPKHKAFQIYAAFMLVAYPLGIPISFAFLLFRKRKTLVNTSLRNDDRDLLQQSTSNLWKPYKPSAFYYEVVECGRRVMLTGVVVFIYPNTAAQIAITLAIAFIFAFTSERLDPYDSHWDGWVSRLGHVMVVLTMYVALLAKMDVSNENSQSQKLLASILVVAHAAMVLTAVAEAIVLVRSVRQRDLPLPRARTNYVVPHDDFSSIQRYSVDRRVWRHRGPHINPI